MGAQGRDRGPASTHNVRRRRRRYDQSVVRFRQFSALGATLDGSTLDQARRPISDRNGLSQARIQELAAEILQD